MLKAFSAWYAENEEKLSENKFDLAKTCFLSGVGALQFELDKEKRLKQKRKEHALIMTDFLHDTESMKHSRYFLCGVYHDEEGFSVVTNGKYLVKIRETQLTDYIGKIIARDGTEIKERFPLWRKVMPDLSSYHKVNITVDDLRIIDSISKVKSFDKLERITVNICTDDYIIKSNLLNLRLALKFWESFPNAEFWHENISLVNETADDIKVASKPYSLKAEDNEFIFMPMLADSRADYIYNLTEKTITKVEN